MEKQYFEAVPVSSGELPERTHKSFSVITTGGFNTMTGYQLRNYDLSNIIAWLRPISLKEMLGNAFTAGYHYGITFGDDDNRFPDRKQYLSSLKK